MSEMEKENQPDNQTPENAELEGSLEAASTEVTATAATQPEAATGRVVAPTPKLGLRDRILKLTQGSNLYLVGFITVLLIAGIVGWVAISTNQTEQDPTIKSQTLSQEALDALIEQESKLGDVSKTLNVEANAIFSGRVLVKDNLDVAGSINVGGPLTLPGITVAGTSNFDSVEVSNNLSILGNTNIQGSVTIEKGLNVTGSGSFTGTLSAGTLSATKAQFTGDLGLLRHIDAGGPVPKVGVGGSIGGGGTVSLSGTDTAGTVNINTGSGAGSGTLANITFSRSFSGTPHVVITPVGPAAANIGYYITRTTSGFTIGATNPVSSAGYTFDFIVID